jgi:NAD(P)-dependent dehydrogenase (short-subunit alcohol dehydrogenase family)
MGILNDKVAVVIGDIDEFSAEACVSLADQGAFVTLLGSMADSPPTSRIESLSLEGIVDIASVDIHNESEFAAKIEQVIERFGRIDCVLYAFKTSDEEQDTMMVRSAPDRSFNSIGSILNAQFGVLEEQGFGSIVLVELDADLPLVPHSNLFSFAFHKLSRTIGQDLGSSGVRFNSIRFSLTSARDRLYAHKKLHELAQTTIFLLSDFGALLNGLTLNLTSDASYP